MLTSMATARLFEFTPDSSQKNLIFHLKHSTYRERKKTRSENSVCDLTSDVKLLVEDKYMLIRSF